ncbi:stage III sporulation protein AG [uncultured Clostridium sp.]|uniref:stage III sporulation protein AG n=1 Tax=uncultured Clostridium sp. TaxID=59620 RepID=UPI00260FD189|nr:stage III sporulation protein AG [uncultured Clostridium sp.]
MDFKKIKEEFNKLMKDKKFSGLIAIVLVLLIMFLVFSFFSKGKNEIKENEGTMNVNAEVPDAKNNQLNNSYEKVEKEELISILQKVDGVGRVDVKMTFESGEEKVVAYDNNTQTTVTEEEDSQGGKRTNEQKNDGSQVVMSNNKDGNEPFVTKVYKPKVVGVMVTAEGASNSKIKYNIEKAVSDLYNLSFDKVNVYPMVN